MDIANIKMHRSHGKERVTVDSDQHVAGDLKSMAADTTSCMRLISLGAARGGPEGQWTEW